MKKEKTVRTYQRRTKSGKIVTVKQHTAKYDAADKMKGVAKKKGAGEELEAKKKVTKEVVADEGDLGFTAEEFKEWYNGTGSAADKKVAKALRAKLGRSGYRKFEDEAIDNYTPRGHSKMFKKLGSMGGSSASTKNNPTLKDSTVKKPASNSEKQVEDVLGFSLPKSWGRMAGGELRYNDTTSKGKPYMDKFVSRLEKSGWKKVSSHHGKNSERVWYVSPDSSHEFMYEYIGKAGSFKRFTSAFIRRKTKND